MQLRGDHVTPPTPPWKVLPQPLDRVALGLMLLLSLGTAGFIVRGDRTTPRIQNFTWQERQVGAEDVAFILTFNRPMNPTSVEENLRIKPPLSGKVSWAGRRMAYTLNRPAPYGTLFEVRLEGAQDRFGKTIQPFASTFRTRDRAFVYIGSEGEEANRLILYNLTQQKQITLTPPNLEVQDFQAYPLGDRLLFSASTRLPNGQNNPDLSLYTVTTGLPSSPTPNPENTPENTPEVGQIEPILDNKDYQNLQFDLSPDGQTIIVQRVSQRDQNLSQLWILRANTPPQPLSVQPGGSFLITPDSQGLAITQGQGLTLSPLPPLGPPSLKDTSPDTSLSFLPKFGQVLDFTRDGTGAAMVQFNSDFTRSLFLITNQGVKKELLRTQGSILTSQFDPTRQVLYSLITQILPGQTYQEVPSIAAIDLATATGTILVSLPDQGNTHMSLSPDGLAILYVQNTEQTTGRTPPEPLPNNTIGSPPQPPRTVERLWLLPLVGARTTPNSSPKTILPSELPLTGTHPTWLP